MDTINLVFKIVNNLKLYLEIDGGDHYTGQDLRLYLNGAIVPASFKLPN